MSEIDNISITYLNDINNIILDIGSNFSTGGGNVSSVNGLIGEVNLTASVSLETLFSFGGLYIYTFNHNLNYLHPIVNVFNTNNSLVYADIFSIDENYVSITSNIDITGYKAVAQR